LLQSAAHQDVEQRTELDPGEVDKLCVDRSAHRDERFVVLADERVTSVSALSMAFRSAMTERPFKHDRAKPAWALDAVRVPVARPRRAT